MDTKWTYQTHNKKILSLRTWL